MSTGSWGRDGGPETRRSYPSCGLVDLSGQAEVVDDPKSRTLCLLSPCRHTLWVNYTCEFRTRLTPRGSSTHPSVHPPNVRVRTGVLPYGPPPPTGSIRFPSGSVLPTGSVRLGGPQGLPVGNSSTDSVPHSRVRSRIGSLRPNPGPTPENLGSPTVVTPGGARRRP